MKGVGGLRDVALVIPVRDDADNLARLLAQVIEAAWFDQIIIVDDGSRVPVVAPDAPHISVIRHPVSRGGGVARNRGLEDVRCSHVLFFDSDDLLTAEIGALLASLRAGGGAFDFCVFRYADSRRQAGDHWGQSVRDDQIWRTTGYGVGALQDLPAEIWPTLALAVNYPWNKIYDVQFLRAHQIGCAATVVHQDIPLHWLGFMAARRVLISDRVCAWHHIDPRGGRLTNKRGRERMEVFAALDMVVEAIHTPVWQEALSVFAPRVLRWGLSQIEPALRDEMQQRTQVWVAARLAPWGYVDGPDGVGSQTA